MMHRKYVVGSTCEDCGIPIDPRSYRCRSHRTIQLWKIGKHRKLKSREQRFWERVKKTDSCWVWIGKKDIDGYGMFSFSHERNERAHRYSYMIHIGKIPKGLWVLHECDNPPCVNPKHLKLGNHQDNSTDKSIRKRIHGIKNPNYKDGSYIKNSKTNN